MSVFRTAAILVLVAGALIASTAVAKRGPAFGAIAPLPANPVAFMFVGAYDTGLQGNSAEIATLSGYMLYVTNADDVSMDIVDVSVPSHPVFVKRIDLSDFGASVTSVAATEDFVAAAVVADPKTSPGKVVVMDKTGRVLATATVGALPDALTFTPDGKRILVANEGEPNSYGQVDSVDPEGSVSIITIPPGLAKRSSRAPARWLNSRTVDFRAFNVGNRRHAELPAGVRIFGPGASVAQDLEPEYITITPDGKTAYVTLQENNAIAILDLPSGKVRAIAALGEKDHSVYPLDASDRDSGQGNEGAINIRTWDKVFGMYMPDQAAAFTIGGQTYVLTSNEGDARDYEGFAEEERAQDVADTGVIPEAASKRELGRLTVTTAQPATASPPTLEGQTELYAFGARSFSIWDAEGNQVWDSGDLLEQVTARVYPGNFNSDNDENTFDTRSDNKGPEPEAAAIGVLDGRTYAFVGLERQGGVVIADVTDPMAPIFQQYLVTRQFEGTAVGPDSGPESISFLSDGPGGQPLLAVSNEITGTVALFTTVPADGATELTLLHNNDGESTLLPSTVADGGVTTTFGGVAAFKAVTDREIRRARDEGRSVVNVYAGDAFLAGATLACSNPQDPTGPVYDAIAQRRIAYDAHIFGNHEFDFTPTFLERFVREFELPDGRLTQPFLSANLDFSGEPSWADLLAPDGLIVGEATDGKVVARSAIIIDPTTTARVGVVGATTPLLPTISSPRNVVVTSSDIPSTAALVQDEIDRLTAFGITKIVVVSHLQDIENDQALVGRLHDVDVAVAGGGDELLANDGDLLIPRDTRDPNLPYPLRVPDASGGDVPVVTTSGNYKYLGLLEIAFDDAGDASVLGGGPKRVVLGSTAGDLPDQVTPDPALLVEVQEPVEACLATLAATPVAATQVLFDRSRSGVRGGQSNVGNLVADAWLDSYDRYRGNVGLPARTPTVIAIQNGGGIRQDGGDCLPTDCNIEDGTNVISRLDLLQALPFDNTMAVVSQVTPQDLKNILERASSSLPGAGGQFLQISGLRVTYDTSFQPQIILTDGSVTQEGERVREVTLDNGTQIVRWGSVVNNAPNVTVVTNNFTAGGGDNYPWLRDNPNKTVLRDASGLAIPYELPLREYLQSFQIGEGGLPVVPVSDNRYAQFPDGDDVRIIIIQP